ncbi:MAG TPA: type III secretion system translocon subunit SctB [Geminicoccaceae bacterium]|nr:type III secretion system translocon subunit SctB [Geminicoccaceae bacterium]
MASVGGTTQTVTLTLQQVEDLDLVNQAKFGTEAEATQFQNALDAARKQQGEQGVNNPTLKIPLPVNAEELGLTADRIESGAGKLAFSIQDLMVLLHQLGTEMRAAGKEARSAARDAEVGKLEAAAEKIKAAGTFALAAGLTGGIMQIAGGVMSGIGAARAANTAAGKTQNITENTGRLDALKQKIFYTKENPNVGKPEIVGRGRSDAVGSRQDVPNRGEATTKWSDAQVKQMSTNAERVSARWNAASQITQGIGNSLKAGLEFGANQQEYAKAHLEAEAKHIGYLVQNQDEIVNNMKEMMADVRAKLAEIQQANNATISKIWT